MSRRIHFDRGAVIGQRFGRVAAALMRGGAVVIGRGQLGIQFERGREIGHRGFVLARQVVGQAAIGERFGIFGPQPQGSRIAGDGVVVASLVELGRGLVVAQFGRLGATLLVDKFAILVGERIERQPDNLSLRGAQFHQALIDIDQLAFDRGFLLPIVPGPRPGRASQRQENNCRYGSPTASLPGP